MQFLRIFRSWNAKSVVAYIFVNRNTNIQSDNKACSSFPHLIDFVGVMLFFLFHGLPYLTLLAVAVLFLLRVSYFMMPFPKWLMLP